MCQWRKPYFPCKCERQCPASNVIKNDTIPRVTKNASENDAALHSHVVKNDTVPQVSWEWHCLAIVNENGTAPQVSMRMTLPGRWSMRMTLSHNCQWEWHCPAPKVPMRMTLPGRCQWEWHCPSHVNENGTVKQVSMRMTLSFTCQWECHWKGCSPAPITYIFYDTRFLNR